jgi:CBS-domain-containing membrane protein
MSPALASPLSRPLVLAGRCAADLMAPNPVSIEETATVPEALALLLDRALHAAPVIDEAGHPVGVLTTTDLLVHLRESAAPQPGNVAERYLVRDIMTPVIFSVLPNAPSARVVKEMLDLKVHTLFVVEPPGVLIGIISAMDVLRQLQGRDQ